jgi:hypothetical protein
MLTRSRQKVLIQYSILLLSILLCAMPVRARADMRIIESNSQKYKVDAVVPDDTKFELGVGCLVKVLKQSTNETVLYEGPKFTRPPRGGTRSKPQPPSC